MAAVLGMARSTRMPSGKRASMLRMGTPAAIEITSVSELISPAIWSSTCAMPCGFTASTITLAQAKSSELLV